MAFQTVCIVRKKRQSALRSMYKGTGITLGSGFREGEKGEQFIKKNESPGFERSLYSRTVMQTPQTDT